MRQHVARVDHAGGIEGDATLVNVLNLAFLIDYKSRPISKALLLIKDTIVFDDGAFKIAQQWKRYTYLFCKFAIGGNAVNAKTEYLGV